MQNMTSNEFVTPTYMNGLKAGFPIALGYLVVSFTFGMTACLNGFTLYEAVFMSMTNVTSAGQFAGMNLLISGTKYVELLLTVSIINIRYLLMSTALSQKISRTMPLYQKFILAFGVTDETFTVASVEVETITFPYFMGLVTLPYLGWSGGTFFGSLMDTFLNPDMQHAAAIALYCMFIALVLPPMKHHKNIRHVVFATMLIRLTMLLLPVVNQLSSGYAIILSACIGAFYGAYLEHKTSTEVNA
ncbi:AzlC family ABC transporter permease [Vallitaleaceae bacterium 9-2]